MMRREERQKLILRNFQSPGDVTMLTALVRDLHALHPDKFLIGVETQRRDLWENNPHLDWSLCRFGKEATDAGRDTEAEFIQVEYPLIHQSNQQPWHFIHAMHRFVGEKLGLEIYPTAFKGDVHLSDAEREARPTFAGEVDLPERYWVMVAGGKQDYTIKWWTQERWQAVVDLLAAEKIAVVQVGATTGTNHTHFDLTGVTDLRGQTSGRELIQLIHHAEGVLSPVTFVMHLAAAVPMRPHTPKTRPCVVVAGAREPAHWEAYTSHRFLHTCGSLPCCDNGGCWKARVVPLNDGHAKLDRSICLRPQVDSGGSPIAECMAMISPEQVRDAVLSYEEVLKPIPPAGNAAVNIDSWRLGTVTGLNVGDSKSNPALYFDTGSEITNIYGPVPPSVENLILGGGGLWHPPIIKKLKEWILATTGKKIAWGIGHNVHGKYVVDYDYANAFDLFGTRDWGYEGLAKNGVWVPCASCMDPVFDSIPEPTEDVGAIVHKHHAFRGCEFIPTIDNFEPFEAIMAHIARFETILTNSYHGAYWATLAGRKVMILDPFSTRFLNHRFQPVLAPSDEWRLRRRLARAYPETLGICREANVAFSERVLELVG